MNQALPNSPISMFYLSYSLLNDEYQDGPSHAVWLARRHLAAFTALSAVSKQLQPLSLWHMAIAWRLLSAHQLIHQHELPKLIEVTLTSMLNRGIDAEVGSTPSDRDIRNAYRLIDKSIATAEIQLTPTKNWKLILKKNFRWLCIAPLAILLAAYLTTSISRHSFAPWMWQRFTYPGFYVANAHQDWGKLAKNKSPDGDPLIVNGKKRQGLITHAASRIELIITDNKQFFSGQCAYPDSASGGGISCSVQADGVTLYQSDPLSETNRLSATFKIPIQNVHSLVLLVRSTNNSINAAHAAWLDLKTL